MAVPQVKDGEFTATIYELIKDSQYNEAIRILSFQVESQPRSRAGLSLLGYCYYQMGEYANASGCYQQLLGIMPDNEEYKLYYAQCLYKDSAFQEATKVACQIDSQEYRGKSLKLQAAAKFAEGDMKGSQNLIEQNSADDPDTEINLGCILYKEGRFDEALKKFKTANQIVGYRADLSYNIALSYYSMKQYTPALKFIGEIIEHGIRDYPELSVGVNTEGIEVHSVGNTQILHETALIEAFNLKAAVELHMKDFEAAKEALTDMPPRTEEELDHVTLHNMAIIHMEEKPSEGFAKMQFLLENPPFPPETFPNLLIIYIKYEYYDLAADLLAQYPDLAASYLSTSLYEFLEARILQETSPEEAFGRFDQMATALAEKLRKLTKLVQQSRQNHDEDGLKKHLNDYEEAMDKYIPVLMAQAKIYWDLENYTKVEALFRKSVEFCSENDTWRLNVAHVLFMQENKYKDAASFYEPIVKKHYENILSVSAIVLANLCVSYIMTSQNEEAEELMRKIEREEEQLAANDAEKKIYHLCIVNLVIGTLYCAKGNFEFGVSRVMKSLEPYQKKLGTDTWFYAKRCFLALIENMAKQMLIVRDSVVEECLQFLQHCETYGRDVKAVIEQPLEEKPLHEGRNTVTYESRLLKSLILQIVEQTQ